MMMCVCQMSEKGRIMVAKGVSSEIKDCRLDGTITMCVCWGGGGHIILTFR